MKYVLIAILSTVVPAEAAVTLVAIASAAVLFGMAEKQQQ